MCRSVAPSFRHTVHYMWTERTDIPYTGPVVLHDQPTLLSCKKFQRNGQYVRKIGQKFTSGLE